MRSTPVRDSRLTIKDKVLALRLYWTFERDLEVTGLGGIHFYVQHGIVTLHGTVSHELNRELLLSLVQQMAGVKGVVDHLQTTDQVSLTTSSEMILHL
ncbi:MAG: BON domain-containing protein [Rhodothermales bacterium]